MTAKQKEEIAMASRYGLKMISATTLNGKAFKFEDLQEMEMFIAKRSKLKKSDSVVFEVAIINGKKTARSTTPGGSVKMMDIGDSIDDEVADYSMSPAPGTTEIIFPNLQNWSFPDFAIANRNYPHNHSLSYIYSVPRNVWNYSPNLGGGANTGPWGEFIYSGIYSEGYSAEYTWEREFYVELRLIAYEKGYYIATISFSPRFEL
jgi:hypothetical protein